MTWGEGCDEKGEHRTKGPRGEVSPGRVRGERTVWLKCRDREVERQDLRMGVGGRQIP